MQAVKDFSKYANRKIARSAQGVLWVIGMEKDKGLTGNFFLNLFINSKFIVF